MVREVLAQLFDCLLGDDVAGLVVDKQGRQIGHDILGFDLDRVWIDHGHVFDRGQVFSEGRPHVGIDQPLHGELDVLGGEFPVPFMPLDTFAQVKSPGQLVRANFPSLGKGRLYLFDIDLTRGVAQQGLVNHAHDGRLTDFHGEVRVHRPYVCYAHSQPGYLLLGQVHGMGQG